MKRTSFWMLAAILFCGAIMTSCSKDDDNNSQSEDKPSSSKYDITLTLFTYKSSAPYIDCEFSYTDHNGKKSTPVIFTGNESGESLTSEEAVYYSMTYKTQATESFPESKFLEYSAFHFTIKDVPAGSTISWETIQRTAQGATAPTEAVNILWPCVMVTQKVGNKVQNKIDIGKSSASAAKASQWFESIIKGKEGRAIPYASGSITVGYQ